MNLSSLIGQTLDQKYRIEKELGRGGMGAVFLSTHLGTERPVALKVIVPQFMERPEFVERFRREARAAGRLRHPNVVDVTDFGFSETPQGRVAYLVMEYLDGCTLGEILEEEKQLPLAWTLDILDQVCSAVHEAHSQGIIHRDLKPDNIWLEPNQRGGYTVKVLDFGIAKLEEPVSNSSLPETTSRKALPTQGISDSETIADPATTGTKVDFASSTLVSEAGTLVSNIDSEGGTVLIPSAEIPSEDGTMMLPDKKTQLIEPEGGTKILSQSLGLQDETEKSQSSELTRVGAVLGTPLYMSPEQCRGEKLSPRSDIYSLAVIVYQMLAGKTPFVGNFTEVMDAHRESPPPPLEVKGVPKKVKKVLFSALSKDESLRPVSAEAFTTELRAHSEGFARLLQRALVIYSEHLPKFLGVSILLALPGLFLTLIEVVIGILVAVDVVSGNNWTLAQGGLKFVGFFAQVFGMAMLVGTVTWMIAQMLAFPLRPIVIRTALSRVWAKKRSFLPAVSVNTFISMAAIFCCFPVGIYLMTIFMLITPSIVMEDIRGKAAFKRSKELVSRSMMTSLAIALLMFVVPAFMGGAISTAAISISRQFDFGSPAKSLIQTDGDKKDLNIDLSSQPIVKVDLSETPKVKNDPELTPEAKKLRDQSRSRREAIAQVLIALFTGPTMLLLTSLTSVITALLYFKTRQAGGETMQELLTKFEDAEDEHSKWQNRIRERLIQSGRVSSVDRR